MFETTFQAVEFAVDAHSSLTRMIHRGSKNKPFIFTEKARMVVDRDSFTVEIRVQLRGTRKRPHVISGHGATANDAQEHFIEGLDIWAEVLK